jgi:hypothetical protein
MLKHSPEVLCGTICVGTGELNRVVGENLILFLSMFFRIKKKDPKIYDTNVKFFEDGDSEDEVCVCVHA